MFGYGEIAELINDQKIEPGETVEEDRQPAGYLRRYKFVDQFLGRIEEDPFSCPGGDEPEGDRKVGLSYSRRADKNNILCLRKADSPSGYAHAGG